MGSPLPKPLASTTRVEDLVRLVMTGHLRIPKFQRGLKWHSEDVVALLESIYLGYPIGSLLFQRRPARAQHLQLGPLSIHAPEQESALWVVDGQQRVVALSASLQRPRPIPTTPDDPWVVYFDATNKRFCAPVVGESIPDTWVPAAELLDSTSLSEWVFQWKRGNDPTMRRTVFDAGSRVREYVIPSYTVEVDQEQIAKEIFLRINKFGRRLEWPEIHDALYADPEAEQPSRLSELGGELVGLGMGRPDEQELLRCLIAHEGLDVTRNFEELRRTNPDFLEGVVGRALPVLRRVLSFLQSECRIPHLRLLPWSAPLTVLTRFFRFHPSPSSRSSELLSRWLWRSIATHPHYDDRTFQRQGIAMVGEDEEQTIQALLEWLPRPAKVRDYELPDRFDTRRADSRIVLLGLASLGPRALDTGRPVDVPELIDATSENNVSIRKIVSSSGPTMTGPANRVLLPGSGAARPELMALRDHQTDLFMDIPKVLRSHAISDRTLERLCADDIEGFLQSRKADLEQVIATHLEEMTAWSVSDRPSLDYLMRQDLSANG